MASKTKRIVAPWLASMMIGLLLVGFQNCTVATEFSSSQPVVQKGDDNGGAAGGNGTGYEGKSYVNDDLQGACTDNDKAKSRIRKTSAGVLWLVRANCNNLETPFRIPQDSVLYKEIASESLDLYVFQNRIFRHELGEDNGVPQPPPQPGSPVPRLLAYCDLQSLDTLAMAQATIMQDTVLGTAGGSSLGLSVKIVTHYAGNVTAVDPGIPVCTQNQSYVSPTFATNGSVSSTSIGLYANSGTGIPFQMTSTTAMGATIVTQNNGIRVGVQTNYIQSLLNQDGSTNPDILCQSKYVNPYNTGSSVSGTQGRIGGVCYVVNEPQPIQVN